MQRRCTRYSALQLVSTPVLHPLQRAAASLNTRGKPAYTSNSIEDKNLGPVPPFTLHPPSFTTAASTLPWHTYPLLLP
jgi:hypothetical protein